MIKDFKALKITLASPEQIMSWSHGEVKKAETINYRTQRAEIDGLMCERIFGPTKNFECYCGKYKKVRYKGIICDKCGVEVTSKNVRRERMGHIKLVTPVIHVWYSHGVPNKLSLLLDIMPKKLTAVIYFSRFMVIDVDADNKKSSLEKVNNNLELEKQNLTDELDKKIKEINDEKDQTIKSMKLESTDQGDVLDMAIEKLDVKFRQKIARLREEYLISENELSTEYKSLISLIEKINIGEIISEEEYYRLLDNELEFFELSMGAEAVKKLLHKIDLDALAEELKKDVTSPSLQKRLKAIQRLKIIEGFRNNRIKPEWMVMDMLPVISPELRPIIQLMGGRFASADLNDLYRRVINRNNRLKRLIELGAPEIILRNEKRMLQEAVDALIDNNHRPSAPVVNSRKMPLKSLSDNLRGKQGRFRQNLLGKRVDYSGRAVIVSGPELSLNECGIPKSMALELFRPFVMKEILERGHALNIKSAKTFFESGVAEVWDILEEVIEKRPVLLNRAPTLHKQGIQAFYPILTSGNAIRINPLVCHGFNADFDGDQMAVHVPLSDEAVEEAKELMMAKNNLLTDADGSGGYTPRYDMVYGIYYLTGLDSKFEGKEIKRIFSSKNETISSLYNDIITLREPIKVYLNGEIIETTAGRLIFNEILPESFEYVNYRLGSDEIKELVERHVVSDGMESSVKFLDSIKNLGFKYATLSGFSFSMDDCKILPNRDEIIGEADKKVADLEDNYQMGLITKGEKSRLAFSVWHETTDNIAQLTWDNLEEENPIKDIIKAKAMKASIDQVKQIAGMRGVLLDPNNKKIELPVRSNFALGLSEMEYFVGSRSTRKVLADSALRTAESGYMTRKLVDVAQGVIVRDDDCGTTEGIEFLKSDKRRISFPDRIEGRWTAEDVKVGKKVLIPADTMITRELAEKAEELVEGIVLRSPMTCKTNFGICVKCYGYDLATKEPVRMGTSVGVIAAQSLGESTTQLTLNTKHKGGIAGVVDVTQGLPRVEELFEARIPKGEAIVADIDGIISIIENESNSKMKVRITSNQRKNYEVIVLPGDVIHVKDKGKVKAGDSLCVSHDKGNIVSPFRGSVKIDGNKIIVESDRVQEVEYSIPVDAELLVQDGDEIKAGFLITKGNVDPKILLETFGMSKAQKYLVDNIQETYGLQGIGLNDKHVEVIVAQMGRYVRILNPGDSALLPGEYKDKYEVDVVNKKLREESKRPAITKTQLMGITAASIRTESFLSAASFQEQVRVLSEAAILGKIDYLRGLKENVIIGRRIPSGIKAKNY